jgi:hypothetical protein
LIDLSNAQLGELKRLAKEIICPYVKNNKCEGAVISLGARRREGVQSQAVFIGEMWLTTLGHFTEEECVYG